MIIDFEHHYVPEKLRLEKGGVKGENSGGDDRRRDEVAAAGIGSAEGSRR